MMEQYLQVKRRHKDALLFFRMGDFFEMFYEDAETASRVLGLTLTSRDKGTNPIPMAGIPHRNVDTYLRKLLRAGFKVAICDQVQDPREATGLVERRVTRIVTPGTLTEDSILEGKEPNYLASVVCGKEEVGLSWLDLSTGRFVTSEVAIERLGDELARIGPAECLVPEEESERRPEIRVRIEDATGAVVTRVPDWIFGRDHARATLTEHFRTRTLEGFGCEDLPLGVRAAGAALHYVRDTQKTELQHVRTLETAGDGRFMEIDRGTVQALELVRPARSSGGRDRAGETLLGVLDRTETAMGGRLLRSWVLSPLVRLEEILARQEAVREIAGDRELREGLREELRGVYDVERITARVGTGRANPRDLVALASSAERIPAIRGRLEGAGAGMLEAIHEALDPLEDLVSLIGRALVDDPPIVLREGGIIRDGHDRDLDELRSIRRDGKEWIARYQAREIERTGIPTLKVGYTKVFGYYLEVTNAHKDRIPADYTRKQTLKNAERFITPELKEYEGKVVSADERSRDREYDLFLAVRGEVARHIERIQRVASALAALDAIAGLAEAASRRRYVFPEMEESRDLVIVEGRHPVLEIVQKGEDFIPNDVLLEADRRRFLLVTGPNMAGKSTYIRQAALLVLMAQIGSGIPAREARIGVVDRIFTRVGASDELTRGKSTFMVEMTETAYILNKATERSLVVLDEIGRGTSTFDGVSIAWAVSEYIHERLRCRTLFATHYHQLTDLAELYPGIVNCHVQVREWGDEVIFLHKIVEGGTDKSYGIHVAGLAGVPREVVERSRAILDELEEEASNLNRKLRELSGGESRRPRALQLSLFRPMEDPAVDTLRKVDPDTMTPEEALATIRKLRDQVR
jgi:DNA mismatch repair protein MutS